MPITVSKMSSKILKKIMETEHLRLADLATQLQISPNTTAKYLRGEKVSRVVQAVINVYLEKKALTAGGGKAAS